MLSADLCVGSTSLTVSSCEPVFTRLAGVSCGDLSGALRELSVKLDRQQRLGGDDLAQLTGLQTLSITETPDTAWSQVHPTGQVVTGHLGGARK